MESISYRQSFGLENPPKGTELQLVYLSGLKWYLLWEDCPADGEDIIEGWFGTAAKARKYAEEHGWVVKENV